MSLFKQIMPDKLEKQLDFMRKNGHAFSCTSYCQIDKDGNSLNRVVYAKKRVDYNRLLLDCPVGNSTVMYDVEGEKDRNGDTISGSVKRNKIQALVDAAGVRCLDSKSFVYFDIAGDGELIQNQGTACGSRKVQARNGRAQIRVRTNQGVSCVAVKAQDVHTAFVTVKYTVL